MKRQIVFLLSLMACVFMHAEQVTVRLDAQTKHQTITGFGGFVCSPQFQYNHMSTSDIKKVWGKSSTVGCNIMRLFLPIGRNSWSQSLATAKTAKQLGLLVFASPWGQPAEWKTNNSSNAKQDGVEGHLKRTNWPDYAQYLEDYVQYMRQNGVELDAISIQNEPDWPCTYAGCLWTTAEISEFVKTYGSQISCKVIAPETIGCSDSYANALNKSDVLEGFDIYGGHQYGGLQSAYKNLANKGKEIWMTEYLINWNENQSTNRNFDFSQDFFNFFRSINTCMLGDFNAWIHYAAKRFYGMLGDGQYGTSSGTVTKRGYVMAHFARFVTGMTRIDASFAGDIEGSAYLSQTGDTVVCVMANSGNEAKEAMVDLPFYTQNLQVYTTSKTKNLSVVKKSLEAEACRPAISIAAQSVVTALFIKSRDRQVSDMAATTTHFDRIDDMKTTKTNFGTSYMLSGTTQTFDGSNPLISSRKATTYGYIELSDRFSRLVMHVNKVTSTNSLTIGKPTLYYVNANGKASSHEYDRIDLSQGQDFDVVLDLSPATLQDGCKGLLSFTCDNAVSKLTITFGDVYLGNGYWGKLSGNYVGDDSNVLEYSSDIACTSIDMTAVTQVPTSLTWIGGNNRVVYVADGIAIDNDNVVAGATCKSLVLTETGGDFRPVREFTAEKAQVSLSSNGLRFVMLPFEAALPESVKAYSLSENLSATPLSSIPANTPVLVEGSGDFVFNGSGTIAHYVCPLGASMRGTYTATTLYPGDYVLDNREGQWGLAKVTAITTLKPFSAYVSLSSQDDFIPLDLIQTGIATLSAESSSRRVIYDLTGRIQNQRQALKPGIYIIDKKKVIIK